VEVATKESWKIFPKPKKYVSLSFDIYFDESEVELISRGVIPYDMDDKWFIYTEDGWVYFHRSWTGILAYWIRLEEVSAGSYKVCEAYVNTDKKKYGADDHEYDLAMLDFVIKLFLLGEKPEIPSVVLRRLRKSRDTNVVDEVKNPWWKIW